MPLEATNEERGGRRQERAHAGISLHTAWSRTCPSKTSTVLTRTVGMDSLLDPTVVSMMQREQLPSR